MLKYVKPGLLVLLLFEIASIFVMLHIYDKFVSNPQNYTSLAIVQRRNKIIEEEIGFLPRKIMIENVPFTSQSPDGVWDLVSEELCEEASMLMVDHYWTKKPLNKQIALDELNKIVDYEIENYGDYRDEDAAQIAQRLRDYFGYEKVDVFYNFSLDFLKQKIAEGRPIIVPAAGRLLKNPNFKQPGPLYHNLVIVGYDGNKIIVNDPGTKNGQNWKYDENTLFGAIHDFLGTKERIQEGRKAMIVVEK